MTDEEKIYVWLCSFEFVVAKKCHILKEFYGSAKNIFAAFEKCDPELYNIFPQEHVDKMCQLADMNYINNYLKNLQNLGVEAITFVDPRYPQKLLQTNDYPFVLYCKGDLSLLNSRCIAVVGTRNPGIYGKTITYDISKGLARAGLTIVSGMAIGVDSISHKASLEAGGRTIAVLPNGFNNIYPKINENICHEIEKKNLVITEYPPNVRAMKFTFVARNRIIAGLSDGVVITAGSKKSGALYTKEFAYDYNRNVYAVPGNISSAESEGPNMLIATSQAQIVLGYKDILKDFGLQDKTKKQVFQLSFEEQQIVDSLKNQPQYFDNLQILTKIESKKLNSYLTTMVIRGIIKKLPGNMFSL